MVCVWGCGRCSISNDHSRLPGFIANHSRLSDLRLSFPVRRSPLKSLSFRQEIGEKDGIDSCFMSRIISFPSYLCRCLHPIPPVICQWYHVVLKWYLSVLSFCQLTITFCIFDFCSYCWRRTRSSWWAALSGSCAVSWCHFPTPTIAPTVLARPWYVVLQHSRAVFKPIVQT